MPSFELNLLAHKKPKRGRRISRNKESRVSVRRINVGTLFSPKYMYRRDNISQEQLDILKELVDAEIPVERPISFKLGKKKDMLFLSNGIALTEYHLDILPANKLENIYTKATNILAKMHNLNISHNHLHFGNISVSKSDEISLIDFKMAKKHQIDWNSTNSIYTAFKEDYGKIRDVLYGLNLGRVGASLFFSRFIENYTQLSSAGKKDLLALIMRKVLDISQT